MNLKEVRIAGVVALAMLSATAVQAQSKASGVFDVAIGKACWVEGYTNSGATWTITIKNGPSVAVVLQGTGVDFAKMNVIEGSPRFDVVGGVEGTFEATYGGGTMTSRIRFLNGSIQSDSGDPAVFHTLVGGEDGGDDDWQDMLLNVTCLHHAG